MKRLQRSTAKRSLNTTVDACASGAAPKKAKVNEDLWFNIPEIPEDQTEEILEEKVNELKKICRATRPDQSTVQTLMIETFPIRRKAVIEGTEGLDLLLKRYPPLEKPMHVSVNT
jgi:hypothetical protein